MKKNAGLICILSVLAVLAVSFVSCISHGEAGTETSGSIIPGDTTSNMCESTDEETRYAPERSGDSDGYIASDARPGVANMGVLDFSFLNEMPAGQHGAVKSENGGFVFEDGTPVKFFGVNIGFGAAFPDKGVSDAMAADLASLGVNMVRIHCTDSSYYGSIIDYSKKDTQHFNASRLDKLDYLIYALKEKGIYIHFDMVCARNFKEEDGFSGEKLNAVQPALSGLKILRGHYFSDSAISKLICDYTVSVLEHRNPYTGLTYAEDPVFAVIQYANESSITWIMGSQSGDVFDRELEAGFSTFLKNKYGTTDALRKAWTAADSAESELNSGETIEKGNVSMPKRGSWSELKTSLSKTYSVNCRFADCMEYLISVETDAFLSMYRAARECGYKGCINCSNFPEGVVDLYLNTLGDVAEKNAYWESGGVVNDRTHYLVDVKPGDTQPHIISELMKGVSADMPFIVTEFNNLPPHEFKADTLFQMASYGSLQGWDGLLVFVYTFDSGSATLFYSSTGFSDYGIMNDPAFSGSMGIAASIFRLGLVREAEISVENVFTGQDLLAGNRNYNVLGSYFAFVSGFTNRFIDDRYTSRADLVINSGNLANGDYTSAKHSFIHAESLFSDALLKNKNGKDWLRSYDEPDAQAYKKGALSLLIGDRAITDNSGNGSALKENPGVILNTLLQNFGLIENGRGFFKDRAVSDTGEIIYDFERSCFLLDSDCVDVFAGRVTDGIRQSAGALSFEVRNDVAAIAIYSVDGSAVEASEKLLLFAIGRTKNTGMVWNGNTLASLGTGPVLYQDVEGTVYIRSQKGICEVYALDSCGRRVGKMPVKRCEGGFEVTVSGYIHYEINLSGNGETAVPVELSIKSMPSTVKYKKCQPLDISGLRVEAVYTDGHTEDVSFFDMSGFDCRKPGKQRITISYLGVQTGFDVNVK